MVDVPTGKTELEDARVFIHVPSEDDNATVTHIDVCHPRIKQILDGDSTYFGTSSGGGFIGLKSPMIERANEVVAELQAECDSDQ